MGYGLKKICKFPEKELDKVGLKVKFCDVLFYSSDRMRESLEVILYFQISQESVVI